MEKVKKIGKGYLFSAALFLILSVITVAIISGSSLSLGAGSVILSALLCVSVFASGIFTGNALGKNGLLLGVLSGIVYVGAFVFLVSTALDSEFFASLKNAFYALPIFFSAVGGIIGANLRK